MSTLNDKQLEYRFAEFERRIKIEQYERNKAVFPDRFVNDLPPIDLNADEYFKLCDAEKENYKNLRGRFSLDPEKRAEGEGEYKSHRFWDLVRIILPASCFAFGINGFTDLAVFLIIASIAVIILGHMIVGENWLL